MLLINILTQIGGLIFYMLHHSQLTQLNYEQVSATTLQHHSYPSY